MTRPNSTREKFDLIYKNYIKDIHPNKKKEIETLFELKSKDLTTVNLDIEIRKYLGINKPVNKFTNEYWIKRGWDKKPPNVKPKKKLSPFSREYWLSRGYTTEEADYERNSRRPIRKEYWIKKGFGELEAIEKAREAKENNNKKGSSVHIHKTKKDHRLNSRRCLEYWLLYHRGDKNKAKESLRKHQSNFSLEKCINTYGLTDGYNIWKDRQEKWQKSLKKHPNYNNFVKYKFVENYLDEGYSIDELYDKYISSGKFLTAEEFIKRHRRFGYISCLLNKSIDQIFNKITEPQLLILGIRSKQDLYEFMINSFSGYTGKTNPYHWADVVNYYKFMGASDEEITYILKDHENILNEENFIEKYRNSNLFRFCEIETIYNTIKTRSWYKLGVHNLEDCKNFVDNNFHRDYSMIGKIIPLRINGYITFAARVDEGLLRSTYEICFYQLCKKYDIPFELEKSYPNSNLRCDFYINDVYIELAPMYNTVEKYREKMDIKKSLFDCLVIDTTDIDDYEDIILGIKSSMEK